MQQKDAGALRNLLTELRPLFAVITKAKTAKIVRTIIETIAKVPNSTQLQVCGKEPDSRQVSICLLISFFHAVPFPSLTRLQCNKA